MVGKRSLERLDNHGFYTNQISESFWRLELKVESKLSLNVLIRMHRVHGLKWFSFKIISLNPFYFQLKTLKLKQEHEGRTKEFDG